MVYIPENASTQASQLAPLLQQNSKQQISPTGMTSDALDASAQPSTEDLANAMGAPVTDKRIRRKWTKEEDEKLRLLVSYWGDQCGKNGHWDKISAQFDNRTNKDCRKRWFHSLDPKLKRGRWTEREDQVLMEAHEKLGPSWHKIAQLIPGRTDDQCSKRYNDVLDPKISGRLREWKPDEDEKLLNLVNVHGTQWRNISKQMEGRTGLTCRNRWRKLVSTSMKRKSDAEMMTDEPAEKLAKTDAPDPKSMETRLAMSSQVSSIPNANYSNSLNLSNGPHVTHENSIIPPVPLPPQMHGDHSKMNLVQMKPSDIQGQADAERVTNVYMLEKSEGGHRQITDKDVESIISRARAVGQKVVILQNTYHYHYHYTKQEEISTFNVQQQDRNPNLIKSSMDLQTPRQSLPPATPGFLELELMEMGEDEFADLNDDDLSFTMDDFQIPFNPS